MKTAVADSDSRLQFANFYLHYIGLGAYSFRFGFRFGKEVRHCFPALVLLPQKTANPTERKTQNEYI
jgi:hypothetical protein